MSLKRKTTKTMGKAKRYLSDAIKLHQQNRVTEAEQLYQKVLEKNPLDATANEYLGVLYSQTGRTRSAIELLEKAARLTSGKLGVYYNLASAYLNNAEYDKAARIFSKLLDKKPEDTEARFGLGLAQVSLGNTQAAEESFRRVIEQDETHVRAKNRLAVMLAKRKQYKEAESLLQSALAIRPQYPEALNDLGHVYCDTGRIEKSVSFFEEAISQKGDFAEAYSNLGRAYRSLGRDNDAIACYEKAIAINEDFALPYNNLGTALLSANRVKEAAARFRKAIELKPDYVSAILNLSEVHTFEPDDPLTTQIENLLASGDLPDSGNEMHLRFALAKAYEATGRYADAFAQLERGNALRKKERGYDLSRDWQLFCDVKMKARSLYALDAGDLEASDQHPSPIFIVGMPRSGTSLIEQVLSVHSDVAGGGELEHLARFGQDLGRGRVESTAASMLNLRRAYLAELAKIGSGKFVTDKMPQNFLYVALILKSFPDAKIIHIKRDKAATCWSNYRQLFSGKGRALDYSNSLDDTLAYYGFYEDLMTFWDTEYPGHMLTVSYEEFTRSQREETERLLTHVGLPWEEACMSPHLNKRSVQTASALQVRKEVYQGSSKFWRNYQPFLNGRLG